MRLDRHAGRPVGRLRGSAAAREGRAPRGPLRGDQGRPGARQGQLDHRRRRGPRHGRRGGRGGDGRDGARDAHRRPRPHPARRPAYVRRPHPGGPAGARRGRGPDRGPDGRARPPRRRPGRVPEVRRRPATGKDDRHRVGLPPPQGPVRMGDMIPISHFLICAPERLYQEINRKWVSCPPFDRSKIAAGPRRVASRLLVALYRAAGAPPAAARSTPKASTPRSRPTRASSSCARVRDGRR
ncbi:MAG: hypothetical protein MZV64_18840 [Ignavibacteriales bacterium]|nr:hypothetical protein [Ignavibacteriales bacterium]